MDNMDKRIQRYFQDELSSVERLNLLREIEKDENLKKQFIETQNMRALLSLSTQEEDMHESIRKYKMFIKRIGRVRNIQVMTAMLKYAAVILLVIASTYWLMEWKTTSERQEWMAKKATMYVPAGQRARILLEDGSTVWLNARSKLTYSPFFASSERRVILEGEGYFEVAHNKDQPFIVSTGQGVEVKVLGTKFNVQSYPETEMTRACLLEGSVEVFLKNNPEASVVLSPNEQITIEKGKMQLSEIEYPEMLLWKEGIYCFENEELENIVRQLELYYDVKILVENKTLAKKRYTCKFRQRNSIEEIIQIMQKIHPFKLVIDRQKNIIILN